MHSRPGVLLLLLYQAIFLNIVVPGHTRGAITLAGQNGAVSSAMPCPFCCPPASHSKDAPSQKDREHCAICNLAAHYTPPPVVDCRLSALGFLKRLSLPAPTTAISQQPALTYYACGPPTIA